MVKITYIEHGGKEHVVDIPDLHTTNRIEEHVVASDDCARLYHPAFTADVDTDRLFQKDVLIFIKCVKVIRIECVRPNGKNVIWIQFDEGPIPKLIANGAAKHIGLHWKGDTDGEADNDQLHNNPLGRNRKERHEGALSSPVTES